MSGVLPVSCVLMASGSAVRFGSNKLLADLNGMPVIDNVLRRFPVKLFARAVVVTRFDEIAAIAASHGYDAVCVPEDARDISDTIRTGLSIAGEDMRGCMFSVCDQPFLGAGSVMRLAEEFMRRPERIVALGHGGKRGNPVIFPSGLFGELAELPRGCSGGRIIDRHPGLLTIVEADAPMELMDIDTAADLEAAREIE